MPRKSASLARPAGPSTATGTCAPPARQPAFNAVCRKADITLPPDIEYAPGSITRRNDWQLEL